MDQSKQSKYESALATLSQSLSPSLPEPDAQKLICEVLTSTFGPKHWSFVGFYDKREGGDWDPEIIYIGEYVSETVFPCPKIKMGKGQCGLCAETQKTQILKDTRKAENYIACDDETLSEIVVPCF